MQNVFISIALAILPSLTFALPFQGSKIVISAANRYAVEAGERIAEKGGNIVDVAVTVALTMSVTNPQFATLGGGGFAVVRMGKAVEALDFRETAPEATNPRFFEKLDKDASITGGAAVAVPGMPAGLWALHKKYGKIHWSKLMDEPIRLAQKGFRVSGDLSGDLKDNMGRFNFNAKKYLLVNSIKPYRPGELLVQKALANALKEMRNRNVATFYSGRIAQDIVKSTKEAGGVIELKDLTDYKVVWRKPLESEYNGYKLYLMPPPSSGGLVIATALQLIEKLKVSQFEARGADELHMLGQIFSRAFKIRNLIADPDHAEVLTEKLINPKLIENLAKSIQLDEATPAVSINSTEELMKESTETTNISVMDIFGNAIAMTITLNGNFGSGIATEKFGILLNNEMDDFTTRSSNPNMFGLVQGQINSVAPHKRPLSSMSPTLVEKKGKVVMALGAPGGPRIITSVAQVLYRTLGRNDSLESAIEAPRVHHQTAPDKLFIDTNRLSPELQEALKKRKNNIEESWQASIYATRNNENEGVLEASFDTRNEGAAGGY